MAYAERRDSSKGPRYRGFYKDSDGRYKSAGTYDSEERALEVSQAAEKYAAELISGSVGGLDPVVRATRTVEEYAPIFLRHHRVEGNTKDGYADTLRLHVIPFLAKVRVAEMNKAAARGYFTALEEAGRSPNIIRQAKVALGRCSPWPSPTATSVTTRSTTSGPPRCAAPARSRSLRQGRSPTPC